MKSANNWPLLLRTLFKRSKANALSGENEIVLPDSIISNENVQLERQKVLGFHAFHGWDERMQSVHPCFLHTLSFPNTLKLMLLEDFPFSPLGLVHIGNRIQQFKPVAMEDCLHIQSRFARCFVTDKGWHFQIDTDIQSNGEIVWRSSAEYLKRTKQALAGPSSNHLQNLDNLLKDQSEILEFAEDCGRRYARLSGDYNPIHWSALTARLLGFKRHLAHGMHNKALCLSALLQDGFSPFSCQVTFKKPIFLPAQTKLCKSVANQAADFWVISDDAQTLHLSGQFER